MKTPFTIAVLLGSVVLSGCLETGVVETAPTTGGNLTGTTATNCRVAIARQTNLSVGDVAIFDVIESEAGNVAQATVAGADKPWTCRTDRNGVVGQVVYSGQG